MRRLLPGILIATLCLASADGRPGRPARGGEADSVRAAVDGNTNDWPGRAPDRANLDWSRRAGCPAPGTCVHVPGGRLLFGTSPCTRTGDVYGIDPRTGEVRWSFVYRSGIHADPVFADGRLFVPIGNALVAFDADPSDGRDEGVADDPRGGDPFDRLWTYEAETIVSRFTIPKVIGDRVIAAAREGIVILAAADGSLLHRIGKRPLPHGLSVRDGTLVAGCTDGIHLIDPESGEILRSIEGRAASRIAVRDGRAWFAVSGGALRCVDLETGEALWETPGVHGGMHTSPCVTADRAFVASGDEGILSCLDRGSGEILWRFEVPDLRPNEDLDMRFRRGIGGSPCHADGKIFFTSTNGFLYAVDADNGGLRWKHSLLDERATFPQTTPIVLDGAVYVRGPGVVFRFK